MVGVEGHGLGPEPTREKTGVTLPPSLHVSIQNISAPAIKLGVSNFHSSFLDRVMTIKQIISKKETRMYASIPSGDLPANWVCSSRPLPRGHPR